MVVPALPALYRYVRSAGEGVPAARVLMRDGATGYLDRALSRPRYRCLSRVVGGGTGKCGWCGACALGGAQRCWACGSRLGRDRLEEFALGGGLEEVGGVVFDGADGGGDFVHGHGVGGVGDE